MQGHRVPSFLPTKKKPASRGDEEERIKPEVLELLMYSSIASLLWSNRLWRQLEGRGVPGDKSIPQLYGRWVGRERDCSLLKTGAKLWYTGSKRDKPGCPNHSHHLRESSAAYPALHHPFTLLFGCAGTPLVTFSQPSHWVDHRYYIQLERLLLHTLSPLRLHSSKGVSSYPFQTSGFVPCAACLSWPQF